LSIFYSEHYLNTSDGKLFCTTHQLIKIGKNTKSAPDYFSVIDGSSQQLIKFEARLIKKNGERTTYYTGDLHTVKTSSSERISDMDVRFLPITNIIENGDLLEMVYVHENKLAAAGIQFSPLSAGKYAVNVECVFEIPEQDSLMFFIANDNLNPQIIKKEKSKIYRFNWQEFSAYKSNSVFKNKNVNPVLFATGLRYKISNNSSIKIIKNWIDLGDWYLSLIYLKLQSNSQIKTLAKDLTKHKTNAKEKMDAIFQYCQKNIRYEQVYLELGEIIPNKCDLVLNRKYGDCKDYSAIIYALAESAGLKPNIVLCYRGRGNIFFKEFPVWQFNHAIIHFNYEGENYWYDGTNRTGIPGITSADLINQPALIIGKNNTHFKTIKENKSNCLKVTAKLKKNNSDLNGQINIKLDYQYATTFFFLDFYLNELKMKNFLIDWVKFHLNDGIIVNHLSWDKTDYSFIINVNCELTNAALDLNATTYLSFNRLFPNILPPESLPPQDDDLFYFDGYNHANLDLYFENLECVENMNQNMKLQYDLLAGPFSENEKKIFRENYQNTINEYKKKYAFRKVE
jgi:hypothetical protein